VLKRFLQGGSGALPPPHSPRAGADRDAQSDKPKLLRVIDLDPHTVGVHSAHWPTSFLATSLAAKPQGAVTAETVRLVSARRWRCLPAAALAPQT